MFEFISEKLGKAFGALGGKALLTEADVDAALRELRVGLLEADVALPAIKHLVGLVRERAVGEAVLKGVNPGQQVVKIVYDAMVELLGGQERGTRNEERGGLDLRAVPPAVILMAGLQGGGKTTTAGKLAKWLKETQGKSVYLASLDVYRPAAIEQLSVLAGKVGVEVLESDSTDVMARAKAALAAAKKASADVLILDTAGRLTLDDEMMAELVKVRDLAKPVATLLVADGQTGQVAVEVAKGFHEALGRKERGTRNEERGSGGLTGLVLTRMDGDARGGAALSMRFVTGVPIYFLGLGEGIAAFEVFRPESLAGRILGQGDVVSLVEKVQAAAKEEDAQAMEKKLLSGQKLDFNDMKKQFVMMKKMGGMAGMLEMLPGMGAIKSKIDASKLDDKVMLRQVAVIDSMTKAERRNPLLLNARRRMRIAKGAGVTVQDVNKLVKMQEQMNKVAKMMRSGGLAQLIGRK
ncbi:MAG: signal recognition particle protein [Proteobacteria bacterium]|nr:signal recognition particle protein [Pseudomonadota bacterium]